MLILQPESLSWTILQYVIMEQEYSVNFLMLFFDAKEQESNAIHLD